MNKSFKSGVVLLFLCGMMLQATVMNVSAAVSTEDMNRLSEDYFNKLCIRPDYKTTYSKEKISDPWDYVQKDKCFSKVYVKDAKGYEEVFVDLITHFKPNIMAYHYNKPASEHPDPRMEITLKLSDISHYLGDYDDPNRMSFFVGRAENQRVHYKVISKNFEMDGYMKPYLSVMPKEAMPRDKKRSFMSDFRDKSVRVLNQRGDANVILQAKENAMEEEFIRTFDQSVTAYVHDGSGSIKDGSPVFDTFSSRTDNYSDVTLKSGRIVCSSTLKPFDTKCSFSGHAAGKIKTVETKRTNILNGPVSARVETGESVQAVDYDIDFEFSFSQVKKMHLYEHDRKLELTLDPETVKEGQSERIYLQVIPQNQKSFLHQMKKAVKKARNAIGKE